ncbi:BACON domain-containing protein, partial [Streptomyces sp. URMC 127]|uniref:BACON domain-containing protein n=1 Tax=Streptomyces sp. URMC 127 TaxID=3423402 RepID=UPI003F1D8BA3
MMTRRPEHRPHATGAHRAHRGAPREARAPRDNQTAQPGYEAGAAGETSAASPAATLAQQPPLRYDPHLDGLWTYCLSVLCEHDAATAALGEVLALAEKRADRAPADEELRPWLYALARWACLRRLVASRATGPGSGGAGAAAALDPPDLPDPRRQAELALLAWPEAAGTTAEQREALELAVRHGLAASEVAAVLGLETDAARALLSSAACEVERTRTALAVVESGRCPVVARFSGDTQVLLGAALRRELVRHVDDCADCRRTAERATAGEPWPGTAASSAPLPVLEAPRSDAYAAMLSAAGAGRQRGAHAAAVPRFDRRGYPVEPKDRTARRGRLRSRAVTTTVVVTVVAAPVLALWAAWHGAPETGEPQPGAAAVSSKETGTVSERPYRGPGAAPRPVGSTGSAPGRLVTEVSVAVIGPDGRPVAPPASGSVAPSPAGDTAAPPPAPGGPAAPGDPAPPGPGRLTVSARPSGTATIVTLTASGGRAVTWSMTADAAWLRLGKPGGVLQPGQTTTVVVEVDASREPEGPWRARVLIAPGGTTVTIEGRGRPLPPTPSAPQSSQP